MSALKDFYESNRDVAKKNERLELLLDRALDWIFDHAWDESEYEDALRIHLGMTEAEFNKYKG